ncbi:hypothetical protein [Stutzerimonas nitrititolerans]|uniref:hypothetical protein n=1 Tax=Stutzerimonas nitrititolerans TaxID=2482751 RepID=UPI0028B0520C|nr:hypothetical protein [Stutzerimonas nitrititolerans]
MNRYYKLISDSHRSTLSQSGIFCFLVVSTLSNIVTTELSYSLIVQARVVFLCAFMALAIICFVFSPQKLFAVFLTLLGFLIVIYSALNSVITVSHLVWVGAYIVDTLLILSLLLLLGSSSGAILPVSAAKFFVGYAVLVIVFTFLCGGFLMALPPKLNLEYASSLIGRVEDYSLLWSGFFGYSAIAATFLLAGKHRFMYVLLVLLLVVLFLVMCFMGGGRGETVIALMMVVALFFYYQPLSTCFVVLLGSLLLLYSLDISAILKNMVIFQRFSNMAAGDMSYRDVLFFQGINLLSDEWNCLLGGCGVGYFQDYYSYEMSMFPHNFIVEMLIVFGLPVSMILLLAAIFGLMAHWKRFGWQDMFVLFFIYSMLIAMKSGSLFGSWLFFCSILYFSGSSFYRVLTFLINKPQSNRAGGVA